MPFPYVNLGQCFSGMLAGGYLEPRCVSHPIAVVMCVQGIQGQIAAAVHGQEGVPAAQGHSPHGRCSRFLENHLQTPKFPRTGWRDEERGAVSYLSSPYPLAALSAMPGC